MRVWFRPKGSGALQEEVDHEKGRMGARDRRLQRGNQARSKSALAVQLAWRCLQQQSPIRPRRFGLQRGHQARTQKFRGGANCRGVAYEGLKDYRRAIADYDQSISINPKNGVAYWNLGNAYSALRKIDAAIRDYYQAIAINPNDFNAFNSRGKAYAPKRDRHQAL